MFNRKNLILFVTLLSLFAAVLSAQQRSQPAQEVEVETEEQVPVQDTLVQEPVFRSGVNFIQVDVFVTDKTGNPVLNLTIDDFEVFEDDKRQSIESFELVELNAVQALGSEKQVSLRNRYDQEREASRVDARVFVIFFDDYHVRYENGVRASLMLKEFLQKNLTSTDLVGIMFPLTPLEDVRLTRNHQSIIESVERFFGRKYDYTAQNEFEGRYSFYPTETVELVRNDVSLSALKGLMIHLGGIREGRKSVLLVSEGYTNYVPPELRDLMADNPAPFENAAVADSNLLETAQFFSDSDLIVDIRDVYSTANRFNTAIYSVDPRGLAVSEYDLSDRVVNLNSDRRTIRSTQNTLYMLSEQTGGRALINQNNFRSGLTQMMLDSSAYYLIGYNSNQSPTDGKFHEIDVKVRVDNAEVRHRPGFLAITEREAKRALSSKVNESPKAVTAALSALVDSSFDRLVQTWVGVSRGQNNKTRITFAWEPAPKVDKRIEGPARILLTAIGKTGGAYYRGRIPEKLVTANEEAVRQRNVSGASSTMSIDFEVEPGTIEMSMAVEDEGGEILDRDIEQIKVPDFTATSALLSTPSIIRARSYMEWTALLKDWTAVPTASRRFRRTDRLLLRFEAYTRGDDPPDIRARILNSQGNQIHPLTVQSTENGYAYQVALAPAHLPPGDYVIELTAVTLSNETTELVAFRLSS